MKVYVICDTQIEAYDKPFFVRSEGEALRAVCEAAEDKNTTFNQYPQHFHVYWIGEYDQLTGEMIPQTKVSVGNIYDLVVAHRAMKQKFNLSGDEK